MREQDQEKPLGADAAVVENDTGASVTETASVDRQLRGVIAEWRATADTWARHAKYEYVSPADKDAHQKPPQQGMSAICNWINWLRNRAKEVETILDSTPQSAAASELKRKRLFGPENDPSDPNMLTDPGGAVELIREFIEQAFDGDEIVFRVREMTDAEVERLPDL